MRKILYLGDYVARTGFGTVSKNIIRELRKHFGAELQLDIVAINYFGEPFYEDENTCIISARKEDGKDDPHGRYFFLKMVNEGDYDGIFINQDLGAVVSMVEVLEFIKKDKKEKNRKVFKSIFYFPVDCKLIYDLVEKLEFFDLLVTYTEFARKEVLRLRPELQPKLKVVPHGNNSKEFYPLPAEEKKAFRSEYFGEHADKFIITNVSRNQPRKDIPSTIFGFEEAVKNWDERLPQPLLYLHMHPRDPLGWDLRAIIKQTSLKEDVNVKLLPKEYEEAMVETETVNKIYNASDVALTTCLGGGWELIYSEAASCKVPIIVPYVTSFIEMSQYGKNAYMLETLYPYCNTIDNIVREQVDIYEVADTIIHVAKSKQGLLDDMGANISLQERIEENYKWVKKKLEWQEVCKQWIEYFKIY